MVHMHPDKSDSATAYARGTIRPVPNQPKTPNRVLRVEESLWRAAQEKAKAEGRTLTSVIVGCLKRYVSTPPGRKAGDDGRAEGG